MIACCFVDDPITFAKTAADETWYHTALGARFDFKHHSYLSTAEPLTYCGTQFSRDAAGQVCMDNVAFVEKMQLEWGLADCNPVRVPITKGTMTRLEDFMAKKNAPNFALCLACSACCTGWLPLPCQSWLLLTAYSPNTLLHQLKTAWKH